MSMMKTLTQPQMPQNKSLRGQVFTRKEIEEAIRLRFSTETGRIVIKHLWTDGSMHRFRVNWWGRVAVPSKGWSPGKPQNSDGEAVVKSRYLKVVADGGGIEITEVD